MTRRFEPRVEEVGAARRFVAAVIDGWVTPEQVEVAVLLTSEVVTNAIVHAGPHPAGTVVKVGVTRNGKGVRVEVSDRHPAFPSVGDAPVEATSGRGLVLVAGLASGWGVVPDHGGKSVWFEVSAS